MFKRQQINFFLKTKILLISILSISLHTICSAYTLNNDILLEQVTNDITYLASDELKGRDNFHPEIKQAANYIAARFQENALMPFNGISAKTSQDFLQKYDIAKISPKKINLNINGQNITTNNLAMVSTVATFSWRLSNNEKDKSSDTTTLFEIHDINQNDDLHAVIRSINKQGGQHLLLLNSAHKEIFQRYQRYFQQGIIKLANKQGDEVKGGIILIALTDTTMDKVISLNASGVSNIIKSELANVIAILPGKTKPNEVVLYSAHYDHLGTNSENNIYNGADDNASGTTAIINLAEYFAKQGNNARTLMFVAFSAEEIGGFGSRYFSQQLDPNSITAMINIEMIGKPSKFGPGTVWMTGMERSTLGKQLNNTLASSALTQTPIKIYKDPYPEQGLFYRSDNATLARLGVPAHSFSSTQLDKDEHYHQVSDDLSSLDLPSLHKVIKVLAIATQPLVDGTITPSRIDKNRVKGEGLIY